MENQEALYRYAGVETLRGKRVLDCSAGTGAWSPLPRPRRRLDPHRPEDAAHIACRRPPAGATAREAGLVGITAAVLGAQVCVTDVGETQLDLLRRNTALNQELARARGERLDLAVEELWWGSAPTGAARPPFDVVVLCDCLFIAVRDSLQDALLRTLRQVCGPDTVLLVAFEERVVAKEHALLRDMEREFALAWVPRAELDTRDVDAGVVGRTAASGGGASPGHRTAPWGGHRFSRTRGAEVGGSADAGEAPAADSDSDSDSDSDGDTGLAALFHQPSPLRVAFGRRVCAL